MGNGFSFFYPPDWDYVTQENKTLVFTKTIRQSSEREIEPLPETTSVRIIISERMVDENLENWFENEIVRRGIINYQPIVASIRAAGTNAIETEFPSRFSEKVIVFMDSKNV